MLVLVLAVIVVRAVLAMASGADAGRGHVCGLQSAWARVRGQLHDGGGRALLIVGNKAAWY